MDVFSMTHRGIIRSENQDHIFLSGEETPYYAIVADGMGGHVGGQVASAKAVSHVCQELQGKDISYLNEEKLKALVEEAGQEVWHMAERSEALKDMGTTLTMVVVQDGSLLISHVGDTRAYLLRDGVLTQLTKDHSYVQYLVDKGLLTQEEAARHPYRNMIMRALGMEEVEADAFTVPFAKGDNLLLCSDGLSGYVTDEEIEKILLDKKTAQEKTEALVDLALDRGGRDNISVIVAVNDGGKAHG
ncbi:MAG: Stp1/IreP family PP2C-type Ser/Thr phosphatase [Christensenellaceae bacterium]|jgi:serine/threonine protein phosphatase PrpC